MGLFRGISILGAMLAAALISGCGEEGVNPPAVKLTATKAIASAPATADNHTHTFSIPFADPGTASQVNYVSSSTAGHTHTVALSAAQLADIKNGMQVVVTSTTDNSHNHSWTVYGGSYLYEFLCYNCHSDGKRGVSGMGGNPSNPAQRAALQNPSGAPVSTSPAASPAVTPITPAVIDGAALYASYCEMCHGALAASAKKGSSAALIRGGINANKGGMGSLSALTDAQLQAISTALQ